MCLINKGEDDEEVFEILQYYEMECNCVKKITEGCLESTVRYDSIYRGGSRRGRTPLNIYIFFFKFISILDVRNAKEVHE